jgi:hypothetical protein
VYAACVPKFTALYIGQTVDARGPINRLSTHLGITEGSSLRRRIHRTSSVDFDTSLGQVLFAAVPLAEVPAFHTRARDYREAIERLVQERVLSHVISTGVRLGVISVVTGMRYRHDPGVINEANRVCAHIIPWIDNTANAVGLTTSVLELE